MSLFNEASLYITPNGVKAGKLYAVKPTNGSGDLTVTRATSATRVNASGVIETVGANVPRLDYSNGTCPSILVEPQRTNLALQSSSFDNAVWTTYNGSVTANQTTAPDGTNTADKITMGGAGSATLRQSISGVSNGTIVTFSLYIKQGSGVTAFLDISDTGSTVDITPTANWVKYTYSIAFNTAYSFIDIELRGASGTAFCYIWGAQLEVGSYATSYIPTTSASVTRNADVISKTGISSLIGQTEGTLYAEIKLENINSSSVYTMITSGSFANSILIGKEAGVTPNKLLLYINASGTNVLNNTSISLSSNYIKCAIAYKSGDWAAYVNGSLIASGNSTFSFNSSLERFGYASDGDIGISIEKMQVKSSALWKTRLSNAELATLTTI